MDPVLMTLTDYAIGSDFRWPWPWLDGSLPLPRAGVVSADPEMGAPSVTGTQPPRRPGS